MEYKVDTFQSARGDGSVVESHYIEECFEDGTQEGNPVVIAELTAENPKYYGRLFENAEFMLQVCRDIAKLDGANLSTPDAEKLKGIQNRVVNILSSIKE